MSNTAEEHQAAHCRWLVIGTGFVGKALATYLTDLGEFVEVWHAPRLVAPVDATARELVSVAERGTVVGTLVEQMGRIDRVVLAAGLADSNASWTSDLVGANALLPGVVALACRQAGVDRFIHLSSAAVQGRATTLTESRDLTPFSPYSRSKALGERVLAHLDLSSSTVILRATSVQGPSRPTTVNLRRIAHSRASSVARPGTQPSPVSSISALCAFVYTLGLWPAPLPPVVLQPWQQLSVQEVLRCSGGREPTRLPRWLCRAAVECGYRASRLVGRRFDGSVRQVEAMWFGQEVRADWAERTRAGLEDSYGEGPRSAAVLRALLRDDAVG